MVEIAASASASLAARSLAAIVQALGAGVTRHLGAAHLPVNSVDVPPDSMARHIVDSLARGSSAALQALKTVIASSIASLTKDEWQQS